MRFNYFKFAACEVLVMKKNILALLISCSLVFSLSSKAQDLYSQRVQQYIQQNKALAMAEQRRSGIPAAITLAQGILETSAGASELMTKANNHFGIKCKAEWTGETFTHTDDAPDECFRKYNCTMDSYKDHTDYLKNSKRYASLFTYDINDYSSWAHGLKQCGYATNPKYANELVSIIENYNLQQYTYAALSADTNTAAMLATSEIMQEKNAPPPQMLPANADSLKLNVPANNITDEKIPETKKANKKTGNPYKGFYAHKGDMLLQPAISYEIRYSKLLEMNDLPDAPLEADMYIYLQRKGLKGLHATHTVQQGETLLQISQMEAIQLKQLRAYNLLNAGDEVAPGTILQLQKPTETKPKSVVKHKIATPVTVAPVPATSLADNNLVATTAHPGRQVEQPILQTEKSIPDTPQITLPTEAKPSLLASTPSEKNISDTVHTVTYVQPTITKPTIADTTPVKPMDEFEKLKSQLDKVVYGAGGKG